MSKSEFGTTETYDGKKSDIDFICMLKSNFRKSLDKSKNEFELNGKKVNLIDFKTYLKNKIYINYNNSKYTDMTLIVSFITISINILFKLLPESISFEKRLVMVIMLIIPVIVIIPFADLCGRTLRESNTSINGFYELSLNILEQIEKEELEIEINNQTMKETFITLENNINNVQMIQSDIKEIKQFLGIK